MNKPKGVYIVKSIGTGETTAFSKGEFLHRLANEKDKENIEVDRVARQYFQV